MRPSSFPVHKLLYPMFYLLVILVPTLQLQLQGPEPPVGLERHHDAETHRGPYRASREQFEVVSSWAQWAYGVGNL